MQKKAAILPVLLSVLMLSGCTNGEAEYTVLTENAIVIDENGGITNIIVDDFDTSLYDLDELVEMADLELQEFTKVDDSDVIEVKSATVDNNVVTLSIYFSNPEDYEEYYGINFFNGTLEEAYKAGYSLDVVMTSKNGKKTIGEEDLMEMASQNVIITDYKGIIRSPEKVSYYEQGSLLENNYDVNTSENENELTYIIFK